MRKLTRKPRILESLFEVHSHNFRSPSFEIMKFIAALSFLAAAVTPVASQSIIDLASADGKYGQLLTAVTNTPGVLDAVTSNFPVSKSCVLFKSKRKTLLFLTTSFSHLRSY